jgi:hypothetical protein
MRSDTMSPRQEHPIVKFHNGRACARLPTKPAERRRRRSRAADRRRGGRGAAERRVRLPTVAVLLRGLFTLALAGIGAAAGASTCDALRTTIDARIRASGVARYTLTTVEADAKADGKVVGTCEQGKKKIVYQRNGASAPAPSAEAGSRPTGSATRPRDEHIETECKDGTVSRGGDCRK